MNCGVIGNTRLTLLALKEVLSRGHSVSYVFGLPEEKLKNKVNAVSMTSICADNNIEYISSGKWEDIQGIDVDVVLELGDSRIIPKDFLEHHEVIGNHGAVLPRVQGAASLVWGRMLNDGWWGVTLFKISEEIDAGDIIKVKEFSYNTDMKMDDFVEMCDDKTIECLKEYLDGDFQITENQRWDVRAPKGGDSEHVVNLLRECLDLGKNIYLPPRTPASAQMKEDWTPEFVESFKLANDTPYPRWHHGEQQ
tara:strand:+ start:2184 stop:2936 length:753 start_codon:yes stop_codon:yes gene_type:complete